MTRRTSVPDDFAVPRELTADGFRLEPLEPRHDESDHEAWSSSIEHIRATPGFRERRWPPADGMSLADDLRDLTEHADDFAARFGFTSTVLGDDDRVVGCVHIHPSRTDEGVVDVRSWVRADRRELGGPLHDAVAAWPASSWPFERIPADRPAVAAHPS
ncbi:N-acetyltransferase [Streptomyces sp. NPDC018610]|uniref:N-acetyltransferase n=1 Tax=Streptomyces sp. NPDC018610 TaxID=3365049 RepID=UPI00378F4328